MGEIKSSDSFLSLGKRKIKGKIFFYDKRLMLFLPFDDIERLLLDKEYRVSFKNGGVVSARIYLILDKELSLKKKKIIDKLLKSEKKDLFELILTLKGKSGVYEELFKINGFLSKEIKEISEKREIEGKVLILQYKPFFVIGRVYLDMLINKILSFLKKREYRNGIKYGVKKEEIIKAIEMKNPRLINYIFFKLLKDKKIEVFGDRVFTKSKILTEEEKKVLKIIEDMIIKSRYESIDINSISRSLKIEKKLIEKYLDILFEEKRVLPIKEGFYIHSEMIDEIIKKLRKLKVRKPFFSIKEFKEITGLSRKYTIPMLELLDYMKITRRVGDRREILI